jgi:hypothetical protein
MNDVSTIYLQCKTLLEALIQDEESQAFFGPMLVAADAALAQKDRAYLQSLLKELLVISRDFPDLITVDVLQKIGVSVPDIRVEVAEIIRHGRIENAEQFRAVSEYVDDIHQNQEMAPVVEALGKMLLAFEQRRR